MPRRAAREPFSAIRDDLSLSEHARTLAHAGDTAQTIARGVGFRFKDVRVRDRSSPAQLP